MARDRIGTSGWSYDHWTGPFYPEGLVAEERLAAYAKVFDTTEVNHSFYQLPSPRTLRGWREAVPQDFVFAVKASRYITHMKKLKDPGQSLPGLLERTAVLGPQRGPLLFQLPPKWRFDPGRLEAFLGALGGAGRCAFELRDPSWHDDHALALLERHNAAFCIYELDGTRTPLAVTADFVYLRLHGPAGAYQGRYGVDALAGWAEQLRAWHAQGLDTYCFFDNDEAGHAPRDASRLRALVRGEDPGDGP
jgi:uncharacterized protein YecE (DUF72 family)